MCATAGTQRWRGQPAVGGGFLSPEHLGLSSGVSWGSPGGLVRARSGSSAAQLGRLGRPCSGTCGGEARGSDRRAAWDGLKGRGIPGEGLLRTRSGDRHSCTFPAEAGLPEGRSSVTPDIFHQEMSERPGMRLNPTLRERGAVLITGVTPALVPGKWDK